jgi:hypothetical protein
MKKYLCWWCMSTQNHNILYFVYVPGINFLNKGICLWKAPKTLAGRGFPPAKSAPNPVQPRNYRRRYLPDPKPSPRRCRGQGAEMVQFGGQICGEVEIWDGSGHGPARPHELLAPRMEAQCGDPGLRSRVRAAGFTFMGTSDLHRAVRAKAAMRPGIRCSTASSPRKRGRLRRSFSRGF